MNVDRVLLAAPRGFCAGVEMAIKALAWMVRSFDAPVYCYHEIVHNKLVVERFEQLGVIFVDDINEVPLGCPIMLSAHGSAPEVVEAARARGSVVVDSVCPLVTKVHHEVKVRSGKGFRIVYVGHEGHEEAVGTMAVAPHSISRVESIDEVDALPEFNGPVALLAQTTLSHRDWAEVAVRVKERFPQVWTPGRSDLCFATTNRQSALMSMAPRCDAIIVIGSANSSNTRALERLAREAGCERVFALIPKPNCLQISTELSESPQAHRLQRNSLMRSSLVWHQSTEWKKCDIPKKTNTSHRPATCVIYKLQSKLLSLQCRVVR